MGVFGTFDMLIRHIAESKTVENPSVAISGRLTDFFSIKWLEYKWEALTCINFLREKERKKHVGGKKEKKKKIVWHLQVAHLHKAAHASPSFDDKLKTLTMLHGKIYLQLEERRIKFFVFYNNKTWNWSNTGNK